MFDALDIPAVILISLTSLALLVFRDWRLRVTVLAIQYVGVFLLVGLSWPVGMSVAKLIAGWMSGAVLGMAMLGIPHADQPSSELPSYESGITNPATAAKSTRQVIHVFYLPVAILASMAALSIAPSILNWIPGLQTSQALGALILICMGTLQLGFKTRPFGVIIGLLTTLAGFEILYAAVENSILVAGVLALINLGLALIGAYLITTPYMGSTE